MKEARACQAGGWDGPSAAALVLVMCAAQLLTLLSISTYAAQLALLRDLWALTNTEAGWIGAAFFIGYTAAVPVLTGLTDRVDAKTVYLGGTVLLAAGCFGFALFARDLASALICHGLAGAGLAGTYMPGLKGLADRLPAERRSRASAMYTASFSLGAALSYPYADLAGRALGWQAGFAGAGLGAVIAGLLVAARLPACKPVTDGGTRSTLAKLGGALGNRAALAYSLGYAAHCWELFTIRTWVVAFLMFTAQRQDAATGPFTPAMIAGLLTMIGFAVSFAGNEIAIAAGRGRTIVAIMGLSALVCAATGFASALPYPLAALICILYGMTVIADSAALTAGALGNAREGERGATMAVHSMLGFAGAIMGPLTFGGILDWMGGATVAGWGLAFAHLGVIALAGAVMMRLFKPRPITGDKRRK